MELALETYRKADIDEPSESIGHSKISIRNTTYRALERLEGRLRDLEQDELMLGIEAGKVQLDAPDECNMLRDCKVRLYIDDETQAGHFHVVGRLASDNSLIYTEPAMVRLIAL